MQAVLQYLNVVTQQMWTEFMAIALAENHYATKRG